MAANIYSYNNPLAPTDYRSDFRINGQTVDEWQKAAEGRTHKEGWGIRDAVVDLNKKSLENIQVADQLEGLYKTLNNNLYSGDVRKFNAAMPSWESFVEMRSGKKDGSVLTFDTETFGDTSGLGAKSGGAYGITEIGINRQMYHNGDLVSARQVIDKGNELLSNTHSETILIGIDQGSDNYKWLNNVINKASTRKGRAGLDTMERVAFDRLTMYDNITVQESKIYNGLYSVSGVHEAVDDVLAAKRGLQKLTMAYDRTGSVENALNVIFEAEGILDKSGQLSDEFRTFSTVLNGANAGFDYNIMSAQAPGLANVISSFGNITADQVSGIRAMAAANNMSVPQFLSIMSANGTMGGASMDSALKALGFAADQAHSGGQDTINETYVGDALSKWLGDNFDRVKSALGENGNFTKAPVDSLYFFHHGGLDKTSGLEFGTVNDTASTGLSFRGQFWEIDPSRTGTVTMKIPTGKGPDGKGMADIERFVMTFTDAAEGYAGVEAGKRTSFTISGASSEEVMERLNKMASAYDRDSSLLAQNGQSVGQTVMQQKRIAQVDYARREWDKILDAGGVTGTGEGASGGYNLLKRYLELDDALTKGGVKELNSVDAVSKIANFFNNPGIDIGNIKKPNAYEMQTLAALRGKLHNERKIIDAAMEIADSFIPNGSVERKSYYDLAGNTLDTIRFRDAYNYLKNSVTDGKVAAGIKDTVTSMTDILGVDIRVAGDIVRIDHTTTENFASQLSSALNNRLVSGRSVDRAGLAETIRDLGNRGLISDTTVSDALNLAKTASSGDMYNIASIIATDKTFNPDTWHDLYPWDPQAVAEGTMRPNLLRSISKENEAERIIRFSIDGKETTMGKYLEQNPLSDDVIREARAYVESKVTPISHMSLQMKESDSTINAVMDKLGYRTASERGLVWDLFNKKGVNYSMQQYYEKEGLRSFIIDNGDAGSAFIAITNDKHAGKVIDAIASGADTSTYNKIMANDDIAKNATILEIPRINTYNVGGDQVDRMAEYYISKGYSKKEAMIRARNLADEMGLGRIQSINLGEEFEVMIDPELRFQADANGMLHGYLNGPGYDTLSSYRKSMKSIIDSTLAGEFEEGSRLGRKTILSQFSDFPSTSSYRAIKDELGNVHRVQTWSPNDLMHANRIKEGGALYELLGNLVYEDDKEVSLALKSILQSFSDQFKVADRNDIEDVVADKVLRRSDFKEFFHKHLFFDFGNDGVMTAFGNNGQLRDMAGSNFFNEMYKALDAYIGKYGDKGRYSKDILETLDKFHALAGENFEALDQIIGVNAYQKGYMGIGVNSATYRPYATMTGTIRPTYNQANNPVRFDNSMFDETAAYATSGSVYLGLDPISIASQERFDTLTGSLKKERALGRNIMDNLEDTSTSFLLKVKNMSDYDLAQRYAGIRGKGFTRELKEMGLTKENYQQALDFFEGTYGTFHEGSVFIRPSLGNADFMTQREAMNLKLDLKDLDIDRTKSILSDITANGDADLTFGSIIGYKKNGNPIFYEQADAILTSKDVANLLPEGITDTNFERFIGAGKTKIMPSGHGDFSLTKLFVGGAEKAMGHTANVEEFMRITGAKDLDTALGIIDNMWVHILGTAGVVGNYGAVKHASSLDMQSMFNIVAMNYEQSGETQFLANLINQHTKDSGIAAAVSKSGRLMLDDSNAVNASKTYASIIDELFADYGDTDPVKNIASMLASYREDNAWLLTSQVQTINEHMGKRMFVDDRMRQTLYLRNMSEGLGGMVDMYANKEYLDAMWDYSKFYNAHARSRENSEALGFLGAAYDRYAEIFNASHVQNLTRNEADAARKIGGLMDAMKYYYDPNSIDKSNAIRMTMSDITMNNAIPRSGMNALEAQNSIFFVDGRPSQFLLNQVDNDPTRMRGKKGILLDLQEDFKITVPEFDENFNKIYVKQGTKSVLATKELTLREIFLPFQEIDSSSDEYFVKKTENYTSRFLSQINDIKHSNLSEAERASQIGAAYTELMENYATQLQSNNKDADMYRMTNKYEAPNSLQVMAREEASPMTKAMRDDKELAKLNKRYDELSRKIADGDLTKDEFDKAFAEYTDISVKRQARLNEIADAIENDMSKFDELVNAPNGYVRKAMRVKVDGDYYYGMVATTSEEAFQKMGLDFNKVGMDVITSYEANMNNGMFSKRLADNLMEGVSENFTDAEINAERRKVVQRINDLGIIGERTGKQLVLDENIEKNSIMLQLNTFLEENYADKKDVLRSLNDSIASGNKGIDAIFGAFTGVENGRKVGLGYDYMERVGTYSGLFRYPLFDSQPVAKLMLDRRLQGNEVSLWNNIFTHKTHVDFDGDTMFLSLFLDGTSVSKINDRLYEMQEKLYKDFAKNYTRKGVAEGIRSGDAIKKDLASTSRIQDAAALRLLNENEYNKAVADFMDNHKDIISQMMEKYGDDESAQTALEFFAMSSDEVLDAFNAAKINFTTDPLAIMMSVAAKERNLYIGNVSTPNYKLRNTLISIADEVMPDEERQKLSSVITDFYNTFSKEGGLLTVAEQKAIDTKKARDALMLARTNVYTTGMSELTTAGLRFADNAGKFNAKVAEGIEDLIVGSGPNVFKFLSKEDGFDLAHKYAQLGQYDYNELQSLVEALGENESVRFHGIDLTSSEASMVKNVASYRGVAELIRDHPEAVARSNLFAKGSKLEDAVRSVLISDKLTEQGYDARAFQGTSNENAFRVIKDLQDKAYTSHEYLKDMVYFAPDIEGDKAYVYDGTGWFDEINPETGENIVRKRVGDVHNIDDTIDSVSRAEYMRMAEIKSSKLSEMAAVDTRNALDILSGLDDGNRSKALGYISGNDIISVSQDVSDDITKSIAAFNHIHKGDNPGADIIRQLNQRIADNPGDYSGQSYIDLANEELRRSLGSNSGKFADEIARISGISSEALTAFNESVDKISNGVYNINKVKADLMNEASIARRNGDLFRSNRAPLDIRDAYNATVDNFENSIDSIANQVRDANMKVVSEAQNALYGSFGKNYKGEMDVLFNWSNGAKTESLVGFGENLGAKFSELRREDINSILDASTEGLSGRELYATKRTQDLLNDYLKNTKNITAGSRIEASDSQIAIDAVNELHSHFEDSINEMKKRGYSNQDIQDAINNSISENAKEARKMEKKAIKETLDDVGNSRKFSLKKGVAIAATAAAALGIAHKLMNAKGSSPLMPRQNRNDEQKDSPDYSAPAPESANKIYVDKETGYKFKLSVKARNRLDALTANQVADNYGGGSVSVSRNDSAINDQWLANRFAELANE